ncbi:MAG: EipA family protein [Sphingomonas bacterium]
MRKAMLALGLTAILSTTAAAQVRTIDPNGAIDGDISPAPQQTQRFPDEPVPSEPAPAQSAPLNLPPANSQGATPAPVQDGRAQSPSAAADTFKRDDLIGAGEGVFGKGAEGFASIIEKILKDQGEPNAYIAGREASGAVVVGLRYGSGIMTHKVEGQMPVYWTGPSLGFDLGGDANKVFVLVYNLYDTEELYRRFPAGEGRLYFVGGFAASYLRRGNIVLIPVRMGVGWRAGVNVGYMKFSHKSKWLPF